MIKRWALLAIGAAMVASTGFAYDADMLIEQRLDPTLEYRTFATENFDVHFPAGRDAYAVRVGEVAEGARQKLGALLGSPPGRTSIVLSPRSDQTSIFTLVHPHRQIFFDLTLPHPGMGVFDHGDWVEWLVTHELTHVFQGDAHDGIYAWGAPLLGSVARPGLSAPAWFREGLAVYAETHLTSKGRGKGSQYRMMIRMAQAEGHLGDPAFASAASVSHFEDDHWPWGQRPYLFGYFMIRTIVHRSGEAALARMIQAGARGFPFSMARALEAAGFANVDELWAKTLEELGLEAGGELARLAELGAPTPLEYLSNTGYWRTGLAIDPKGRFLLSTLDRPGAAPSVEKLDLGEEGRVGPSSSLGARGTGYQSSVSKSGRFVAYDGATRARHDYVMSDIIIRDLKESRVVSVSPYLRARDPDIHPDGKHLVLVLNDGEKNALVETDTAWQGLRKLPLANGDASIAGPRYSPDGSRVVVSVSNARTGGHDLWEVGETSSRVLVADGSHNLAPSWTPEGRYVLFSSDAPEGDGAPPVANIHALEVATGKRFRLSHVTGGLFSPVADPAQRWIYVSSYRSDGYDLARLRWDPATWVEVPNVIVESPPVLIARAPSSAMVGTSYRSLPYLAPQYAYPVVLLRPGSSQLGARAGAIDPLYFKHYEAELRYDAATRLPLGGAYWFDGASELPWDLTLAHDATPIRVLDRNRRVLSGEAAVHVPLLRDAVDTRLRIGVIGQQARGIDDQDYAGARVAIRSSSEFKDLGQSFAEQGGRLELEARELRGFERGEWLPSATLRARRHLRVPVATGHVAHLGVEAGSYMGPSKDPNRFFAAGGQYSFPYSLSSDFLFQGFGPNAVVGDRIAVADALYTLPIANLRHSSSALPMYFGTLSLGARSQLGVASGPQGSSGALRSFGLELYQDFLAGGLFALQLRVAAYRAYRPSVAPESQWLLTLGHGEF